MSSQKGFHATGSFSIAMRAGVLIRQVLLTAVLLQGPAAFGQTLDYTALEDLFEEPVTTSVTGSPQRASDVPATMEIITADEIRRSGARDIPGALRQVTGLNVLRWTNSGADVGVRGYNKAVSSRLLVLVNGRQVYADHYGYTPWSAVPVELAEIRQIEIVKGPNSALYGFNAVGGVINIITYNPRYDDVAFANLRAGTQNTREIAAARSFSLGERAGMRLSGGARKNDNFMAPIVVPGYGEQGGEEERASGSIQAFYLPAPDVEIGLEATYSHTEDSLIYPTYNLLFQEMTTKSVKAQILADTAAGLLQGTFYRNWVDDDVIIPGTTPLAPVIIGSSTKLDNQITYMGIQDIFKVGNNHTLRLSGEYRESSLFTLTFSGGKISYQVWSGAGMWNWQVTDALAFTAAVRVDRLSLDRYGAFPSGFPLPNSAWERTIRESSYNAGMVWNASANDTLRLTLARGVQLPNLFALGGSLTPLQDSPFFIAGLPDLHPTVVTSRELAWDRRFPALNMTMRAAAFLGRSSDVLADYGRYDFTLGVINAPVNVGNSEITGAELSLQGNFADGWRWGAGYTYAEVDDRFLPQYPVSLTLMDYEHTTPRHQVNLSIGRSSGNWEADAYLYYQSAVDGIRPTEDLLLDYGRIFEVLNDFQAATQTPVLHPVSDYATVDARVAYRINDSTTVAVSGQNLLHSDQIQTIGPTVERRILMTLSLDF